MRNTKKKSIIAEIRTIFLVALTVVLVATFIFSGYSIAYVRDERTEHMETVTDSLSQSAQSIASSVVMMAETISNTRYTRTLLTDNSVRVRSESQQALNRLVLRLVRSSSHVQTVLLLDDEGKVYSFSMFDYALVGRLNNAHDIFLKMKDQEAFSGALTLPDEAGSYYVYAQPVYENYASKTSKIGTCIVVCSTNSLHEACERVKATDHAAVTILDHDGQMLASNHLEITNGESITYTKTVQDVNWTIKCEVPYADFYKSVIPVACIAAALVVVLVMAFVLMIVFLRKNVVQPIEGVVHFLRQSPKRVLRKRLEVRGNDEIAILSENINMMLDQINELNSTVLQKQTQLYEEELLRNQAQLQALKMQINPHFMYNSLNSIQGLACQSKFEDICDAVAALSFVLRYSLRGGNLTTVREEAHCIEEYMRIMNIRFENRFRFSLDVEKGLAEHSIPRFMLQPIVENAIMHGLGESKAGTICVSISCDSESLMHVVCADDGMGICEEKLDSVKKKLEECSFNSATHKETNHSIGLENVQRRLKLLYGESYGLKIESQVGHGTTVSAAFPAMQLEDIKVN